ncbi:MAG: 4'-phosphopantetheinyl transferase superfamily protein [Chitinophagaceae bacterium]|nr:4'-phosphopantetheinyl transferase superfamily protein [Chitinophagaceae bacterium]
MPLFYTQNINETTRLAVWHITEPEAFFNKIYIPRHEISHPHKRLQHLAGRFLLCLLDAAFPVNKIQLDGRRPYLPDNSYYFSISHCSDYAAAIVSRQFPVGIDVELVAEKLLRLEKKFLNEPEQLLIRRKKTNLTMVSQLTLLWSTKECMFKWYAKGNVDFRKDMAIKDYTLTGDAEGIASAHFGKEVDASCTTQFRFFDNLCLAWLAQPPH